MRFSNRLDGNSTGVFAELAASKRELIASGMQVIDLSVGTPDLPPAPHVISALREAAACADNYIYAIDDRDELLLAAARWYERRFGVVLSPREQICSLLGSQDGLAHLSMALIDPGDTVLVPDPGYPIFAMGPTLAGARLCRMPQTEANGYVVDLDAIPEDVARRAKLMVVSYPNNPVASVAPPGFYEKLVAFARNYDIVVLHDNAYCELTFDGLRGGSFLATPGATDVGVEFNSLSKTYNMAGCRVGFALGNAEIIRRLRALKSHIDYGMFLPIQMAGEAALNGPQHTIEHTRDTYARRRDLLVDGLGALGWRIPRARATMFLWARLPEGWTDSVAFSRELMRRTGVIVVPGVSFGEMGEGHVRIALVQSEQLLSLAIERIAASGMLARDARKSARS